MEYRFILFFCLMLAGYGLQSQTETRAERSALALSEQAPGKLFEQRLSLLEQAILSNDVSQMLSLQRDLLMTIRETIDQTAGESAKISLEGVLSSLDNFSFHTASGSERQSKLEALRSVRALIP